MTGRCKTCKFWGRYQRGCCDRVDDISEPDPTAFAISVRVLDDSGLSTSLMTGPEFGCIHWLEKGKSR